MAKRINGPLYYERSGRSGPVIAFVHPNPMDQSCWMYQMAHLSTWYRCVAIDIPGYGRSPTAEPGLTTADMAEACWEAVDDAVGNETAILVGSSVGSLIVPFMYHQQPNRTAALIMAGVGYYPGREFVQRRIDKYTSQGLDYRAEFTFALCSPAFRATPLAHYFAELFCERNDTADLQTIIHQFEALRQPEPESHHSDIACPATILTGTEDAVHQEAFDLQARIPNCELKILPGAGHVCQLEQPWLFDRLMIEFLTRHGLFPGESSH